MPLLSFLITDLHRGGSPLMLADLAPGLAAHHWDVQVVSVAPLGQIASLLQARGIKVASLNARFTKDLAVVPRFVKYLRHRQPDIVCSILVHANLLAAMAMPFVQDLRSSAGTNITWVQSIHTVQEKPAWHWWLQGIIGPLCDGVVTPSAAILQKLRQYGPVPRGRVIGNGIQVRRFFEARVVADVPWPPGKKIVGYIGRFDPVKRLGLLIEAIARLPEEYQLALVGYGQEEQRLRGLVKRLYLERRVHFTGATTEPERWYKAFDVFCLPSAAEGFPLSLAEAVSAGVPVVACDTPAVRETVPEAVWVKAEVEVNELAQALVQGAGQPPNRISLSELEKRYSVERMVQGYEGYFQSLRGSRA